MPCAQMWYLFGYCFFQKKNDHNGFDFLFFYIFPTGYPSSEMINLSTSNPSLVADFESSETQRSEDFDSILRRGDK